MKRILATLLALAPSVANAQTEFGLKQAAQAAKFNTNVKLVGIVAGIVKSALALIGILFLAMMIYGGFQWMTAMGENEKVDKGKQTMVWAVFGLIVIIASYGIATFVLQQVMGATGN